MRFTMFRELPEEPADYRDWRPWFAWRPVFLEDGTAVWLETIEWRPSGLYPPTLVFPVEYRLRRTLGADGRESQS